MDQTNELVNLIVTMLGPRRRGVQEVKKEFCCEVSDQTPRAGARNRTLHDAGGNGKLNPHAIELEG